MDLTAWLLENSGKLSLRAEKYRWIEDWMPGFFDYCAVIRVGGKEHSGRGIDRNEKLAFEKAASEALERAVVDAAKLGMPWSTAAYPDTEGADLRAYRELLGIDRVFCHHYSGSKMRKMDWETACAAFPREDLKRKFRETGIEFSLYELRPTLDAKVVCAMAWGGKFRFKGFLSGFGVGGDLDTATGHAVIECLRTAAACLHTEYAPSEPLEVLKRKGEPRWHFWMAQHADSLDYLRSRLLPREDEEIRLEPENISIADASFTSITTLRREYPDMPLQISQAQSDKLITPQFGRFVSKKNVSDRLISFGTSPAALESIPPHFYG